MKKGLLHIVLFAYAAFIQKPLMPFLKDFISHTFYYAKHLATENHSNGNHHLHNELAQNVKDDKNSGKDASSPIAKDNLIVGHCLPDYHSACILYKPFNKKHYSLFDDDIVIGINQKIYLPPRFINR